MKNRLLEFLNTEQISASRLAEIINVQASSISHILSERNKPGFDFLVKLFTAFPRLNPKWLMLGIGQMYADNQPAISRNNNELQPQSPMIQDHKSTSSIRDIKKIIIFYSDNTFETYDKNSL